MFGIGVQELLVILAIVVLIFGAKNLPRIGTNMGRAIRNFKSAVDAPEVIDVEPVKDSKGDNDGSKA